MEQPQDGNMESGRKTNMLVGVLALAAFNLGVLMIVAQARTSFMNLDAEPRQGGQHTLVAERVQDGANYRFSSCSGGDSVNCHISGNQAGL